MSRELIFPALEDQHRKIADLTAERERTLTSARAMLDAVEQERRDLTETERTEHGDLLTRIEAQGAEIDRETARLGELERLMTLVRSGRVSYERGTGYGEPVVHGRLPGASRRDPGEPVWIRTDDRRPAALASGERFADHDVVREQIQRQEGSERAVIETHGDLGNLVRAITTSSGSAVVPTVWAGNIIDRARNLAAVLQAGATIVPMPARQVQVGRLTGDPAAAFRTEGSTITASDPTFDNVTLDSKTMSALVVGSMEWFQDANNVDDVVTQAIASAVALQLDLVALYGSITSGAGSISLATPPNPRGVLGTLNAVASTSVLGGQTNGTAQTAGAYWNEVIDTIFTARDFNEEPTGLIWNSKAARQYARAYDSNGQPLAVPSAVAEVPRYVSNQIPSYTQGTMAGRATDLFAGDWRQLLIGQRLNFTIQTLTERYAENGQIGIVAHWRGDVQVARPRAFAVYRALQGA
ncbi:phage major capsid protein [Streptosporangium sp. NPDC051022]|uniref:phage major capsid protein n=1 Tax=Streptosporangium sp. NPDC051022 TaxID=3155752 RepID=UPI003424522D